MMWALFYRRLRNGLRISTQSPRSRESFIRLGPINGKILPDSSERSEAINQFDNEEFTMRLSIIVYIGDKMRGMIFP